MSRRPTSRGGSAATEAPITPLRLPAGVRTLIVFGGSFDPPHVYHEHDPLIIRERLFPRDGCVVYVPTARNPLKAGPVASDRHRLAMLRISLRGPGHRVIWTDELDRAAWARTHGMDAPSYTIDTLRRLRKAVGRRFRLRLLIGADQAASFHEWKDYRDVVRLAEPLVMPRGAITTVDALYVSLDDFAWTQDEMAAWCSRMAPVTSYDISSTQIREAIAKVRLPVSAWDRHKVLECVSPEVAAYIAKHGLYGCRVPTPSSAKGQRARKR